MMKRTALYIFLAALLTASCSTTRYVPDGDMLYTGIKSVEFTDAEENATGPVGETALQEARYALDYAPNGAIAGSSTLRALPIGLWWYNALHDSQSKVGKWLFKKLAKAPVLISRVNPDLHADVATNILKYYGYFNSNVEAEIIPSKKNPKEAKVSYKATLGTAYHYDTISYCNFTHGIDSLIRSEWDKRIIREGQQFDAAAMEQERNRISNLLRNNGYYYFQPTFITFLADTVNHPGYASIRVQPTADMPQQATDVRRIGDITIRVRNNATDNMRQKADTLKMRNISYIYYGNKVPVRMGPLLRNIQIRNGELYSQEKQQNAVTKLSRMNIFNNFRLNLVPREGSDLLDLDITTQLDKPYDFTFELKIGRAHV